MIRGANHCKVSNSGAMLKSPVAMRAMRTLGIVRLDTRRQVAVTVHGVSTFFDAYLKGAPASKLMSQRSIRRSNTSLHVVPMAQEEMVAWSESWGNRRSDTKTEVSAKFGRIVQFPQCLHNGPPKARDPKQVLALDTQWREHLMSRSQNHHLRAGWQERSIACVLFWAFGTERM